MPARPPLPRSLSTLTILRSDPTNRGSACCKQSNRGENVGGKSVREEVEFSLLTIGFMGVGHPEVVPPLGLLVRDYSAATRGYQTAPQQQLIGNTGHLTSHSPIMHSPPSPPLPGSAGLGGGMNTPLSHPRGSHAHALHARPHIHSVSSPTAGSLLTSWLSHGRHSPHHPHRPPLPHPASTHLPAHNPDSSAALAAHAVAQNIASIPISPVFSALSDHAVVYSPRHPWQIEARLSAKATFSGIDLSCPPSPVSPTPPTFLDIRSVQCRSPIISPSNPSLDISLQGHEAEFLESGDSSSDSELLSAFPPGHGNQMIIAKPKFSSYRHAPEDLSRAKISWWLRGIENSQGFRSEWPPSKKTGPVALSGYVDQVDLSSDETCPSDPIFFGEKDLSDLVSDEETELSYLTFDHP